MYYAIIAAAVVISAIFTPKFLVAQKPGISAKSRTYKMICATMFVLVGLVSMKLGGNTTAFALYMFAGLVFAWIGDLMLHISDNMVYFAFGVVAFAGAHVMYLIANRNAWTYFFPGTPYISVYEIIAVAAILGVCIAALIIKKMEMKAFMIAGLGVYGTVLSTMFVKSLTLGVSYAKMSSGSLPAAILLIIGAFFFLCSDATLALLLFDKKNKGNFPLKCFNIFTYFSGQLMLAATIIFIKTA